MSLTIVLPLLLLATSVCASNRLKIEDIVSQQRFLTRLMMQTYSANAASERATNTVDVDGCFTYYVEEQDSIVTKYNTVYKNCIVVADDAKREISNQNDAKRQDVVNSTNNICTSLTNCDTITDGLEFFQCTYVAADANYGVLYGISVDSKERVNELNIKYQQIDYQQNLCTTQAYNNYMSALDKSNKDLQKCLNGDIVPPATTTTTTATTITTLATPVPAMTTEPMPEEDLGLRNMALHRMAAQNLLRTL